MCAPDSVEYIKLVLLLFSLRQYVRSAVIRVTCVKRWPSAATWTLHLIFCFQVLKKDFFCYTHTCASMQVWMHTHDNTLSHTRIRTHLHCELSCLPLFLEGDTWSATRMLGVWNTGSHTYTVAVCWRRSVPVPGWMGILCYRVRLCGCFPALLISLFFISFMFPFFSSPSLRALQRERERNSEGL